MQQNNGAVQVLVVEDDVRIAQALAARLKHEGFQVTVAGDAIGAVSEGRRVQPDVAILDISMPGGDGFDVARRLDAVLQSPVPKIFITASKAPGLRQRAVEAGAVAFVEKPFTSEDLRTALDLAVSAAAPPDIFE